MAESKNKYLKAFLSIFIVFHFYAVVLAPNSQTYLGSKSSLLVGPYVNFFAFLTNWSFFAPEPGPPPVFLEWELLDKKGISLGIGRWPEFPDPYFFRDRQNRRITAARSMVESDGRAERMMVPYLCEKNKEAGSVRLWGLMYAVPTLNGVAQGVRKIGDQLEVNKHWIAHSYCTEFSK